METNYIRIQGANNFAQVTTFSIGTEGVYIIYAFYVQHKNNSMQGVIDGFGTIRVHNNTFNAVSTELILSELPHSI